MMPAPVFLCFAAVRESRNVTISAAAEDLGIAAGWLHELEDFVRVADPAFRVRAARGFGSTFLSARLAEVVGVYTRGPDFVVPEFAQPISLPPDAGTIAAMLSADAFFHSCISHLANIFLDFRSGGAGYQEFFRVFISHLLCRGHISPAVIYAPHDPATAYALDYALRRVWGPTRMKRKSARQDPGIRYESTGTVEPGQPLGILEGKDAWHRAFWLSNVYPDRKPYFAYLVLYICLKKITVALGFPRSYQASWPWPLEWCYKILDRLPDDAPPAGAAMVLDTAFGDVTVFFRTLLEPNSDFYLVAGDAIP